MSTRYSLNIARRCAYPSGDSFQHWGRVEFGDVTASQAKLKSSLVEWAFNKVLPGDFKFELTGWEEIGRSVDFTEGK